MCIRSFLCAISILALLVTNLEAQDRSRTARIGLLVAGSELSSRDFLEGLRQGLKEQGLIEGQNIRLETRYANGQIDLLHSLAGELVGSGVDLIHVGGDQASSAAKRATHKIPIVAVTCDALAAGLVTNLSRPGENLTGVTCINSDLSGKRVELIKESIPSLARLGALLNPNDQRMVAELKEAEVTAKAASIAIQSLITMKSEDIEPALSKAVEGGMSGVLVIFDSMTFFNRLKLADLAIRHRLATIFNFRQFVDVGGLMSFGPNLRDMYRQSARHIQKLLRAEAAGEIVVPCVRNNRPRRVSRFGRCDWAAHARALLAAAPPNVRA
jgi:putative ABC transport system substrate-binding protein